MKRSRDECESEYGEDNELQQALLSDVPPAQHACQAPSTSTESDVIAELLSADAEAMIANMLRARYCHQEPFC